jgi:Ni,Fe-hydrogenase I large subunit
MARIVVDPITRIEGHLRIEADIAGGKITDAFSSGTMVRGFEKILKGRDPRDAWAFTERACGVCTTVHALASVRTVENALGITVPPNAEIIRNLMFCAQYLQDHVVHFYHLHALDWVDVVSALSADPEGTSTIAKSISSWPKSSPRYFADVQKRIKTFAESGQLGIFANGYWGHPAYKLPPEVNLLAVAHYLEALEWQKEVVKVHAIFGGKNPHPNYLVGGAPCSINPDDSMAINAERLAFVGTLFKDALEFVEKVYLPDLLAVAGFYPEARSSLRVAPSSTATSTRCTRSRATTPTRCASTLRIRGTATTARATTSRCIRGTAKPTSTTRVRSRRTTTSIRTPSTAGSRRHAGRTTRWRSVRCRACLWLSRAATPTCRRSSRKRSSG